MDMTMKINKAELKRRTKISLKRRTNWWVSFPLMAVGALQANLGFLNNVLTPQQFGAVAFAVGMVAFAVGWFKTRGEDNAKTPQ